MISRQIRRDARAPEIITPGWYYRNPTEPMPWCSWCETPAVNRSTARLCPECDAPLPEPRARRGGA